MGRLNQISPNNYATTSKVSQEFENVIRYIVSAERGQKTLAELLSILFDEDGLFAGPIELRYDAGAGIQYRVGTYTDASLGWVTIATTAQLTGPAGTNVGTIEGPLFYNRVDITATSAQTDFPYAIDAAGEDVLVYQNGLLLKTTDYTKDTANDLIILGAGATTNDIITIITVRAGVVTNYRRQDTAITTTQSVVAFAHTANETFQVYKNGVLQRSGGSFDYTSDASTNTITFTSSLVDTDLVSIVTVENESLKTVSGLMLKEQFTNADGAIPFSKLAIADGDVPPAKITGLADFLATGASVVVSGTTPNSPASGDFWIDTSLTPNQLKFYDGTQYLNAAPESTLPSFTSSNANQYVRVNGSGTGLEYGNIDFSSLVPKTYMAAANGVASLDANGQLPHSQLPTALSDGNIYTKVASPANGANPLERRFGQSLRIEGVSTITSSGTINVFITVDGVDVAGPFASGVAATDTTLATPVTVDTTLLSKAIGLRLADNSASANLEVTILYSLLS